jgi:catechol 2,3-dioxygenase-like lactoylglutathione lyase family enzyme
MPIKVQGLTPLIEVFDMPTSVAFYRDVIGFEVVMQSSPGDNFDWGLLRMGDAELMFNTAYDADERPAAPDLARWAGHPHTTLFFFCPDLDEAYKHLRSKGIAVEKPVVRHYGMRQLSVTDPDGYGLCFQYPAKK